MTLDNTETVTISVDEYDVDDTENKLTEIVKKFVEQHKIGSVFDIYPRDSVIVSAYLYLIHQLVETVGYHKETKL